MIQYLVLQWNGMRWCADNSVHALVPAGPYSSEFSAQVNIDKYVAENAEDFPECAREVRIVPVEWPEDPPPGACYVKPFGS